MADLNPCVICEEYMKGVMCRKQMCPVALMKAENKRLKEEISKLKWEMSYMVAPNSRDANMSEMGAW